LGNDGNNFQNATFSCAGGGAKTCTVTSHRGVSNYYMNSGSASFLPVIFSGIATSRASANGADVVTGGYAFLYTDPSTPNGAFELYSAGQFAGYLTFTFSGGSFTGTVNPAPCVGPFQRLFFATKDGLYNFFQGTGTIASETTLYNPVNQNYWQGSGVIPPYNLSVNGAPNGGALNEYVYSNDWYPYNIGQMTVYEPGTGDHSDIGILPLYASNEFYCGTLNTLRHNRIIGLSCAFSVTDFVDASTKKRLNLGNPSGGYGLAASSDSRISFSGSSFVGNGNYFSVPNTTGLAYGLSVTEHEPAWPVWAYLRTGELQYLDLMIDQSVMSLLTIGGNRTLNSGNAGISETLYGCYFPTNAGAEMRAIAWGMRDQQWPAHLYPRDPSNTSGNPVFTDGTNIAQYLTDNADANARWPLLQFQTPAPTIPWTAYTQEHGYWTPWIAYNVTTFSGTPGPAFGTNDVAWEYADFAQVMCLAAARGNTDAVTFLESCPAVQWAHDLAVLGGWLYISDTDRSYDSNLDDSGFYTNLLINSDAQYGMPPFPLFDNIVVGHNYVTWRPNSSGGSYTGPPAFVMTGGFNGNENWHPSNGDIYIPQPYGFGWPDDLWPSELSAWDTYYVVNLVSTGGYNYAFDLSTTLGGSPILITDTSGSNVSLGFRLQPVYKPSAGTVYTDVYCGNFWFATCWATALGIVSFGTTNNTSTVLGDLRNRMAASSVINVAGYFSLGPGELDSRYCMQPSFA
jgi:hypothetical protein